ncbi:MAG TPA: hypothetical protein VK763_11620 [Terriglobales bacterium]|nr:hypothetical protein [Terriglobales bacterium]
MTMLKPLGLALVMSSALIGCPLLAQTSTSPAPGVHRARYSGQPCWKQAGISPSVVPQLRQIHQTTHSEVMAVRSDSSLTSQQMRQKTRQLRQQEYQQLDALVGSQQLAALRSCREQRARTGTGNTGQNPPPQQP